MIACTDVAQAAEVVGSPAVVQADPRFATLVASLDTLIVRPLDPTATPISFLYALTSTASFTNHTYAHVSGTTVLHLKKNAVPAFRVATPPAGLVRRFGDVAAGLLDRMADARIDSNAFSVLRDRLKAALFPEPASTLNRQSK